jgi:hypothetical protein
VIPDHSIVVRRLYDTGLFNLMTHEGQGAFVDAVVATLHAVDERWGHLRKKSGQSHIHKHAEDAALYLSDTPGQSQAVDFIGGAGGPNPQPAWNVDQPRYSEKDWLDPFDHGLDAAPPPAPAPAFLEKGAAFIRLKSLDRMYRELLLRPEGIGGDMEAIAQWFFQIVIEGKTDAQIEAQLKASDEYRMKHR